MNYNITEEIPEFCLGYGLDNYGFRNIFSPTFSLLVRDDTHETGYANYMMVSPTISSKFRIGELEEKYEENPEKLNFETITFKLLKSNENVNIFKKTNFRISYNQVYMTDFEKKMFSLLKKAYEYYESEGNSDLLESGEIGLTHESRTLLYLGAFNDVKFKLIDIEQSEVRLKEFQNIITDKDESYDLLESTQPIAFAEQNILGIQHIYIEIDNTCFDQEIYNFDYDISTITWRKIRKNLKNIYFKEDKVEFVDKYHGNLNTLIEENKEDDEIFSCIMEGSYYNDDFRITTEKHFEKTVNRRNLIGKSTNDVNLTGELALIHMSRYQTGYRKIQLISNERQ